ncbi:MAG: radical SAM family heme chaperone HemW [Ruminococcus sp.]|nr:radical SAM family heme chaperone HemW [Ruminococcus sp.]
MKRLYIHVPFCVKKCLYCDFYSITDNSLIDDYIKAVIRNIPDMKFDTLYFGGGTPSLLTASQIAAIIEAANPTTTAEISMECNPQSSGLEYFREIRKAGVNRLSIGIQSLHDETLRKLGRLHDSDTAVKTVYDAYEAGFENISADIMLGVSDTRDSAKLCKLPLKHISAYMLKVEKNTPFYSMENLNLPDEDSVCDAYLEAVETFRENGFMQYEISNFAKAGYECKHNLGYWECEEYIGIGPSAHSYSGGKRFAVPREINAFIEADTQPTYITDENPGGIDERLMLGLRLMQKGVVCNKNVDRYVKAELLRKQGDTIFLTPKGALVSNSIITDLVY